MAYKDATHQHGVTHVGGVQRYWYNANGAVITRTNGGLTLTLAYDAENRLIGMSGGVTEAHDYDGDGKRVKAIVNGTTSIYIGAYFEVTGGITKTYYYAGNVRVAERTGGTPYYLLTDHLGGTNVTVTASGTYSTELRYYPYGGARYNPGGQITSYRFTGQRWDSGTGLYWYQSRWYDPLIGRFIQADTIVPEPGNPQSLNRYTYANNAPLTYIDSDGHFAFVPLLVIGGIALLKAIDYGWIAYDAAQSLKVMNDPNASEGAKTAAAANLAMTVAFEAAEPDGFFPVALPLDDLARKGILKLGKEVGQETVERVGKESTERAIKGFATPQKLSEHFKKHGAEFGFKSESEYLAAAQKFASSIRFDRHLNNRIIGV